MEAHLSDDSDEAKDEALEGREGTSKYEPVAEKYAEIGDDEAMVIEGLEEKGVESLRNLLYGRFGKQNVSVKSVEQESGGYKAIVRNRQGDFRDED